MSRTVNEAFEEFLGRLRPTDSQRTAGASHRASVKSALESSLEVNGFYETGSFSHGTGVRGYSDIDVLVSIGGGRPESSYSALTTVKEILSARFPSTSVSIRRPAVSIQFGSGYETWEVLPAYMTGRGGDGQFVYDIPGPNAGSGWIDSSPKQHLDYVNECNAKPSKGNAKALARLVKAWKYYCNVPVSSFYLEMRAAKHVAAQSTYIHVWDLCQLLEAMYSNGLAAMNDPKGASGRIHACASDSMRDDALSKLGTAARRARTALDAYLDEDFNTAFSYLNFIFDDRFPSRT